MRRHLSWSNRNSQMPRQPLGPLTNNRKRGILNHSRINTAGKAVYTGTHEFPLKAPVATRVASEPGDVENGMEKGWKRQGQRVAAPGGRPVVSPLPYFGIRPSLHFSRNSVGAILCHVPWFAVYVGKIPGATGKLSRFLQSCIQRTAARVKRGSETRDLFHYLVCS